MGKRGKPSKPPPHLRGYSWVDYCRFPKNMSEGHRVQVLVDGSQAYPAMLESIAGAQKTILMGSYIFHADQAGRMFAEALIERAQQGVKVYLIVDGLGTIYVPSEFFTALRDAGVRVLVYRSLAPWRLGWGLLRRDHRKLLVVDGRIGFAGGLNIGDEWLPREQNGLGWHDVHLQLEGPAVRELSKQAISTWKVHGDEELEEQLFLPNPEAAGDDFVNIIGSRERKKRKAIRQSYLHAIRAARHYIYIANAYFLPGPGFRRALKNAVARGVDVRVMVPARGDILSVQLASQALFGRLLRRGIRIFLWQEEVLHAKTAVIDDEWATVGSFNIDHRSWAMNLEVNINVVGAQTAQELKANFLADQAHCQELSRFVWRKRSFLMRLVERFFFLFRKLM